MDTLNFNKGVLFVNRQLTVIVQKFNYLKTCSLLENIELLQKKTKEKWLHRFKLHIFLVEFYWFNID